MASPANSSSSTAGANPDASQTPAGRHDAASHNRHRRRRIVKSAGSSCQRCAPTSTAAGTATNAHSVATRCFERNGLNVTAATNPRTTLGSPAMTSTAGLIFARAPFGRNSPV